MKEEDIRPEKIFDEYLRLAKQDAEFFFKGENRLSIRCPACNSDGEYSFTKSGFDYRLCENCWTLFVSPRPPDSCFARYYQESESVRYWASTFYKQTADARRERLWRPKARMVHELIGEFGTGPCSVVDIGGGYGIFAEEYQRISRSEVTVVEPSPELARACREKGLPVLEEFLERIDHADLPPGQKAFVSFELFEHLSDVRKFMKCLYDLMSEGDLFIFTTLSGTGVDIQALWEDSKSVSPPHHLNFLNPKSVRLLLENVGLTVLTVETPGQLDIDIMSNNFEHIKDRFWRMFIHQASEEEKRTMQEFVAGNGLSSHMLAVSRKPEIDRR